MENINTSEIPTQPIQTPTTQKPTSTTSKLNTFKYLFIVCFILILVSVIFSVLTIKYIKSKSEPTEPNITEVIPTAIPTEKIVNEVTLTDNTTKDWKTYKSKLFDASISLPDDWQDVWPADGTLHEISADEFESYYSVVSSPDEKEQIVFEYGRFDVGTDTCTIKNIYINHQIVNEIICPNSTKNENPGKYNYEFVDKNLSISFYNKTSTIEKIISLIKFN